MPVLITGGCGFIGTNLAHRLLLTGRPVHLFDNLSRLGGERNLLWLQQQQHGALLSFELGDIREFRALAKALENASEVYHLASHEGTESSLTEPLVDFDVNARGTLNLLNAIRESGRLIPLVHASSSKVYGPLPDLALRSDSHQSRRYRPCDRRFRGIDETRALDLCVPYACSKGVADSYVLDYARIYGIPALVFRMSSIYGSHRFGSEEEEWISHFMLRTLRNLPITIYGDGKQVRDLLFVDDLVDALLLARAGMDRLTSQVFNIGGGEKNAVSVIELLEMAGEIGGRIPRVKMAPWRTADSRYYVTNYSKFQKATQWAPRVRVREGLEHLYRWIVQTRQAPPVIAKSIRLPQSRVQII